MILGAGTVTVCLSSIALLEARKFLHALSARKKTQRK